MKNRYWNGESPNLNHVSIAFGPDVFILPPAALGILYRLAWFMGTRSVKSFYSDPAQPEIPNDPEMICRVVGCSPKEWEDVRESAMLFLSVTRAGTLTLRDLDQIRIGGGAASRPALPMNTKKLALARDGRRCVYCGDIDGPFHFDHLYPRSKGGSDLPDNIVVACAPCNFSKGDKTLKEWMANR